jgi:predicted methyltransferase
MNEPGAELTRLLLEVARAVDLQEGEAGVEQVLRAIQQLDPASTRAVARQAGLPLPVAAAVSNELRRRGLVTRDRPSKLTVRGQSLLGASSPTANDDVICDCCHGSGLIVPKRLDGLVDQLTRLMSQAPPVDLTLDQSHATAETKVRRVLFMLRYGLLPRHSLLLVGDDDLMAIAVAAAGSALGQPLVQRLAVVDISSKLLKFTQDRLATFGVSAELVEHDLRKPLPQTLSSTFDLAMTDPPYTAEGARLFLSRAVEGLRAGPGRSIVFSFGPKGPEDTLQVQEAIARMGLTVQAMHRDFNEYHGAGVIAGRSHLYYLGTTERTAPIVTGRYSGPMYTADMRAADRTYLCLECDTRHVVGPGAEWHTIASLKEAGCPVCGGHRFRPLQLVARSDTPK